MGGQNFVINISVKYKIIILIFWLIKKKISRQNIDEKSFTQSEWININYQITVFIAFTQKRTCSQGLSSSIGFSKGF